MDKTIPREHLIRALNWRYATKQFDPSRAISEADWTALEEAVLLAPAAYGFQPWRLIVIRNAEVRQKLLQASYGQRQIVDASHLAVFAIRTNLGMEDVDRYIARIAHVRSVSVESLSGLREAIIENIIQGMDPTTRRAWAARQAYLALGTFLTSAALLGIDACPMEGFEPEQYDEILGLRAEGLQSVVIAAAGFRTAADPYARMKKVRLPKSEVVRLMDETVDAGILA